MQETKPERAKTLGQWSALCAKSIRDHLAPKGFAEIRTGVFKGTEKSNIDFLSRQMVDSAGKIAGGCVNHYRNRLKEYYKGIKTDRETGAKALEETRNGLSFWKFRKRADLFNQIEGLHAEVSLLDELLNEMDYISIQ